MQLSSFIPRLGQRLSPRHNLLVTPPHLFPGESSCWVSGGSLQKHNLLGGQIPVTENSSSRLRRTLRTCRETSEEVLTCHGG